ncbi:receptor-like protein EIX2 [Henckelia pumila]|uniref:receptor-like protein EIX2 n=1 Tax=Henckelia pumila TaxID=405737 RepID=UPI003C6DE9C4
MVTRNRILTHFLVSTILVLCCFGSVFGQHYSSKVRCFERERQALLKFRYELVDEYGRLSSWGVGENERECCKWRGVSCDNRTNHVAQLNLRGPKELDSPLKGSVSSSLLELKQYLTHLDLSNNDFGHSNIPEFIGSFEKLHYLDLSSANFQGSIPPSVGNLSVLMYLDFSGNYGLYSDNLDWVSHLGSLQYLDLTLIGLRNASNWKSTLLPFPPSMPPLLSLAILDLSDNLVIPSSTLQWILNFSKSLTFIDLSNNNITSPMSTYAFHRQIFLSHLDLFSNALEEGIPKTFGNMSSLIHLSLGGNCLTAQLSKVMTNLSGPLEKKLQYLDLSGNRISGSLPNISRFSFLNHLDLCRNKLNDSIANGFLNIGNLTYLDLSANYFTGTLPDLTIYPFLQKLYLDHNMFNGHLTESIGFLSKQEDLVVGSNNLEGIVNETHFSNLFSLQILDLSDNSLLALNCSSHWIPPFQLRVINLSQCNIGPRFPPWLRFQRKLQYLDVSFSHIVDTIPSWFGNTVSTLTHLNASNNQIHGVFPIIGRDSPPVELYRTILDLSRNKITGQATFLCHYVGWQFIGLWDNLFSRDMPSCFAKNSWLKFLNLANNNFSGEIPDSFGSLPELSLLNMRNNSFTGGIPQSLKNCGGLEMIDLGKNRLTGKIPTWIGDNLSRLIVLSLRFNMFHGTIPWGICRLQGIQVLDLSSNKISGIIPKCLHNLTAMIDAQAGVPSLEYGIINPFGVLTFYSSLWGGVCFMWKGKEVNYVNHLEFVQVIDLSNNALFGDIPAEITDLKALVQLNLSRNNLTGSIPRDIGLLKSLDSLDLSRNHLSGGIPISLCELSFLGTFNLSYNNLSGRVPPQMKFDESSYMGNSGLCGCPILDKSCPGEDEINQQDARDGDAMDRWEYGDDDKFITKGFYISVEFGFIIGFWGIFGTTLLRNSPR